MSSFQKEEVSPLLEESIEMIYQKIIWKAAKKSAVLAIFMTGWNIVVGTPVFHSNTDHSNLPNGDGFFVFHIHLLNCINWTDHTGGDTKTIFVSNIKNIKEMTEEEYIDSLKYANMAPAFAKRIGLSTF
jgi:hypothetical protein